MSKYNALWNYIVITGEMRIVLSFDEIESILGFPIDHSFLNSKKELLSFGYFVDKISLKNRTVLISKME